MKKISLIVFALAAVFSLSALCAEAGEYRKHSEGPKRRIFKELNLTPEQEKKLEENRKSQYEEIRNLHKALRDKQDKLQQELKNPAVTPAKVAPLVKEIKSLQGQLIDIRIKGIFAVKAILTPEQFAKFQQVTERWRERRKRN